jgi:hypothetical protein
MRADRLIDDPLAVRVIESIDFDFDFDFDKYGAQTLSPIFSLSAPKGLGSHHGGGERCRLTTSSNALRRSSLGSFE